MTTSVKGQSDSRADARLVNLLGAAATGLTDAIESSVAAATGLDPAASQALIALLDFSPAGPVDMLSRGVGLTHSGAVRLTDRLVNAGYVVRAPGTDARSVIVRLSTAGRRVARRARTARHDAIAGSITSLSEPQQRRLAAALEVVIEAMTHQRLELRAIGGAPAGGALCRMCDFAACGRPTGDCPAARTVQAAATNTG
jgi:MarR family transcriptional regulator, negative regulator of the multidrug operon emrRAB